MRKDLRAITADGAAFSVMVGVGEAYLPAFVVALSANQLAAGLVATVPMAVGAALQLVSPHAIRRLGSYRLWVVLCGIIQAATFIPLIGAAAFGSMPLVLLFALASVYWAMTLSAGPAWNVWVETLVPRETRASFFARRTVVSQVGLLLGLVAGGLVLHAAAKMDRGLSGFALLFLVAAIARLASVRYLATQREFAPPGDEVRPIGIRELATAARRDVRARPLLFMLGMQFAVFFSAPYFAPYMLVQLDLSYAAFMTLTCTALVAKILLLPACGRLIHRWGPNRVLWVAGLFITPIPVFWAFSDGFAYLMALQVLAGMAWAGYELAMLLLFFETVPRHKRVGVLTVYNLANALAVVLGSACGGMMLRMMEPGRTTYFAIFIASAVVRAASLLLLVKMPKFGLSKGTRRPLVMATRPIAVRPQAGSLDRPVLPSLDGSDPRECRPEALVCNAACAGPHGVLVDDTVGQRIEVGPENSFACAAAMQAGRELAGPIRRASVPDRTPI